MQCHYCSRDFSCANESRPGVSVKIITPSESLEYLRQVAQKIPNLSVVGIAGPGDPFANPEETMQTLRLVKKEFPALLLCVATNGLNLFPYISELAELAVSHVTVTVNAVDPTIGARFYAWMRYDKKAQTGEQAAEHLWNEQKRSIKALDAAGITVKINTVCVPGINLGHVEEIARTVKELGASLMNIIPLYPVKGTLFGDLGETSAADLSAARAKAALHIEQMTHCQRCRADACGMLGEENQEAKAILSSDLKSAVLGKQEKAPVKGYVAVATREGFLVNRHLGETDTVYIYDPQNPDQPIEVRPTPIQGIGDDRWTKLAELLSDCSHILCAGVGPKPTKILEQAGIKTTMIEGLISEALKLLAQNQSLESLARRSFACGSKCQGNGLGCG
jgi:nitrogen fixation protein NifB